MPLLTFKRWGKWDSVYLGEQSKNVYATNRPN